MMNIAAVIIAAFLGAVIYRLRGKGIWPGRPWWQIAFALPFALVAIGPAWWVALIVLATTTGAVLTGHASYMDLGSVAPGSDSAPQDGKSDEWYGAWLPIKPGYWHDFAGLVISGLLISGSAGIALIVGGRIYTGLAVIACGALKAPAYALAWAAYRRWGGDPIPVGEILTGAALWGALASIALVMP